MTTQKLVPYLKKRFPTKNKEVDWLVDDLIRKAEGVFLWLDLMVKDLIVGARNLDSLDELQLRLARTPGSINGMYAHKLQSLDSIYLKDAFRYFQVLLAADNPRLKRPVTLLGLACAEDVAWEHVERSDTLYFQTAEFAALCQGLETRLVTRCGGLVEVQDWVPNHVYPENDLIGDKHPDEGQATLHTHRNRALHFIHRTAAEYVQGQYEFADWESLWRTKANALLARTNIGLIHTFPQAYTIQDLYDDPRKSVQSLIGDTMTAISTIGDAPVDQGNNEDLGSLQTYLMDQVCQTVEHLYASYALGPGTFFEDTRFLKFALSYDEILGALSDDSQYPFIDRLSWAAYHGCSHYLESFKSLKTCSGQRRRDLCHTAVLGLVRDLQDSQLRTILVSLQPDVDPNELFYFKYGFGYGSLWGTFWFILCCHLDPLLRGPSVSRLWLMVVVKRFLSLDADPNTVLRIHCVVDFDMGKHKSVLLRAQESPLALIEDISRRRAIQPSTVNRGLTFGELSEILTCLKDADATAYRRCQNISWGHEAYELSSSQSSMIIQETWDGLLPSMIDPGSFYLFIQNGNENDFKIFKRIRATMSEENRVDVEHVKREFGGIPSWLVDDYPSDVDSDI
ncbi:MAG: hypothetical protein Q9224_005911 [Gallowayella concinna]